jgi:hypothetical protein
MNFYLLKAIQVLLLITALHLSTGAHPILAEPSMSTQNSHLAGGKKTMTRVLWTVSACIPGPEPRLTQPEAEKYLGKALDINEANSEITFDGETCTNVMFSKKVAEAWQYLDNFKELFGAGTPTHPPPHLTVVTTNCRLDGFAEYYVLEDKRPVILLHGFLIIFQPFVQY